MSTQFANLNEHVARNRRECTATFLTGCWGGLISPVCPAPSPWFTDGLQTPPKVIHCVPSNRHQKIYGSSALSYLATKLTDNRP